MFSISRVNELFVDNPKEERITVRLNITVPRMSCECEFFAVDLF